MRTQRSKRQPVPPVQTLIRIPQISTAAQIPQPAPPPPVLLDPYVRNERTNKNLLCLLNEFTRFTIKDAPQPCDLRYCTDIENIVVVTMYSMSLTV